MLAQVNGVEYRSRLMVYGGKSYLGLRKDLLRRTAAGTGDMVEIDLVEDASRNGAEQAVAVEPPELSAALAANRLHRPRTTPCRPAIGRSTRRWIAEGKKAETRAERVRKTIRRLSPALDEDDARWQAVRQRRSSRAFSTTSAIAGWIQYWPRAMSSRGQAEAHRLDQRLDQRRGLRSDQVGADDQAETGSARILTKWSVSSIAQPYAVVAVVLLADPVVDRPARAPAPR